MTSTPEVIQARRTESLDAPEILKLVSATTEKLFGRVDVVNIMWVNSSFDSFVSQAGAKWSGVEIWQYVGNVLCVLSSNNWRLAMLIYILTNLDSCISTQVDLSLILIIIMQVMEWHLVIGTCTHVSVSLID